MWFISFIFLVAMTMPSQVTAKSWLVEGPKEGGKQTCRNDVCTCNGKIEGISISSSSSVTNTSEECQTYYLEPCRFHRDGSNIAKVKLATSFIGNLPQDLKNGFGYALRVTDKQYLPNGEEYYGIIPMDLQNENLHKINLMNVKDLSIDLCPTQHIIYNDTLANFHRIQKLKLAGKNATMNIQSPGFLAHMETLTSLRIINVKLETISIGEFCHLQLLDEAVLTFTHPSVINGFNCRNISCEEPCLESLVTANLTGNDISRIDFSLKLSFPLIEELLLSRNLLTSVDKGAFRDLTRLKKLDLSLNNIIFVHHLAFSNMPNLKSLNLAHNDIKMLDFSFFKKLPELANLSLAYNMLQRVNGTYFPNSIEEIQLQGNNISMFSGKAFLSRPRRYFRLLNLKHNNLRTFSKESITSCDETSCRAETKLDLMIDGNRLDCSCSMEWLREYLKTGSSHLRIPDLRSAYSICWNQKEQIDTDVRSVLPLGENDFVCPCQEAHSHVGIARCTNVQEQCPSSCACSITTKLSDNNIYITDCSNKDLHKIPRDMSLNSTLIRLDGNNFGHLQNSSMSTHSTRVLFLNNSKIESIHDSFFGAYPNVVTLYLHDNKLKTLPHDMFVILTSLTNVSIHDNLLTKISVQMLPNATSDIQRLTLYGNPWNCDCDYGLPLKEWIENNLEIVKGKSDITCGDLNLPIFPNSTLNFTSDLVGNLSLEHYGEEPDRVSQTEDAKVIWQVDFRKCHEKNITVENPVNKDIIIIASALGVTFIFIVVLGILIYYFRELILVWLYNSPHTNWFWRPKGEENDNMENDAYVVSTIDQSRNIKGVNHTDIGLVKDVLSPKLEGEKPHFILYLEYRDPLPGWVKLHNVQHAVDKSRRIIILLTENFLKDNICLEAFKMAHYRATEDKKMRLIVLLVGDPPRDQMPEDLQNYIKSGSHLKWGEKWFWEKLIYKMPHVSRDPRPLDSSNYFRNKFMRNGLNVDIRLSSISFSDDGQGIRLGSLFSDTSELNETKSEVSVEIHSSPSVGYASQSNFSDFCDSTADNTANVSPSDEEMSDAFNDTDDEEEEGNNLLDKNLNLV